MSGPTKQNSTMKTTIATPATASLFLVKVRRTSWATLPCSYTSPPSAPSCCTSAATGTKAISVPHPRVEHGVRDVGDEVAEHGRHSDEQGDAEHDWEVVGGSRVEVLKAEALEVEELLEHEAGR